MQGLMVVGLTVEEILNVDVKCVKGTGAQNIGQGHRVKIPAESVHLGEALCKVWWLDFFFFLIWVLRPFQEYFTYIEPIVHRRWAKTGVPGEKPPDHP